VFTAGNAFFFLIAWEIMALTAYCLVSFEHEQNETRRAGVLYFVMSHIGTGCIMLGFLLLFQAFGQTSGDYGPAAYSFENFHALGEKMAAGPRNAAFLLFLIGFGVKAGIVPLHTWLPAAHPVAPSNISAFMSGVLIKTGIYGMARVFFDFLGEPPMWWGATVLTVGTVSAVLGVLYALMQHDLKRLLAYHSIENIGIILMGFGAALLFLHSGHPVLATLALIAGLYHTINHAIFKALLFLGAGAVLHATHTRDMEHLGGLAKRMPKTAFFFLIGAVAISALPPLNGFVSEWLTYQSLLQGFGTTTSLFRLMFPLSGAMLALTGALAAACFVKAFGITFLAQPRSDHAAHAHEVSPTMLLGQGILTAVCVFLGLFPTVFLRLLDPVTSQLTAIESPTSSARPTAWCFPAVFRRWHCLDAWHRAVGHFPAGCAASAVADLRAWLEGPHRPNVGLWPQRVDAADGIHGHGILEAHPDDFQSALPSAARSATRIRLLAVLHQDSALRGPRGRGV
jgi:hydrogenase-4 component B